MELSVKDTAKMLGVSQKTIYRWLQENKIPAFRLNGVYRFDKHAVIEWLSQRAMPVSDHIINAHTSLDKKLPTLHEALRNGGVFYRVGGSTREDVLKEIVSLMPLPELLDRNQLFKILLLRENLAPTAIGGGIALPHVRSPVVMHTERPLIMLSFLENKVDFLALDRKPVHIVFTIISPTIRTHLHLLRHLTHALQNEAFLKAVKSIASREKIFQTVLEIEKKILKGT